MASLIKRKTAKGVNYHIQLSDGERAGRPKISLGKCNKRNGETAKVHIEALKMRSGHGNESDIQVALNGLYGLLILRLKKCFVKSRVDRSNG